MIYEAGRHLGKKIRKRRWGISRLSKIYSVRRNGRALSPKSRHSDSLDVCDMHLNPESSGRGFSDLQQVTPCLAPFHSPSTLHPTVQGILTRTEPKYQLFALNSDSVFAVCTEFRFRLCCLHGVYSSRFHRGTLKFIATSAIIEQMNNDYAYLTNRPFHLVKQVNVDSTQLHSSSLKFCRISD
jgi:hypothetical protein